MIYLIVISLAVLAVLKYLTPDTFREFITTLLFLAIPLLILTTIGIAMYVESTSDKVLVASSHPVKIKGGYMLDRLNTTVVSDVYGEVVVEVKAEDNADVPIIKTYHKDYGGFSIWTLGLTPEHIHAAYESHVLVMPTDHK